MSPRAHRSRVNVERAFGQVLRDLRLDREISQEAMGNSIGSGRTYMSELERGEKGPTLKTIFRLARKLDVAPSELVRRVEALKPDIKDD